MADLDNFEYSRSWENAADFPSISYTKSWESSDDFPTIETDETQVRADMQSLYTEISDYINGTNESGLPEEESWEGRGLRQYVVATGGAEETRIANEEQRQKNENGYTDEEEVFHNGRVQNETARQTAETARDHAENGYTDSEEVFHNGRVQNENARILAEQGRVNAEDARVRAEQARADETSGIVAQSTAQATLAQSYARGGTSSRSGEDTDNAKYYSEQAADSATTASTKAGEASGSATTASTKAGEASDSATTAAAKATLAQSYAVGGTGTRAGEDTDNAKYYKEQAAAIVGADFVTQDELATVEETSTASKAYATGAYFVYDAKLCRATSDIAQGGTITVGTNCEVVALADEVATANGNLALKAPLSSPALTGTPTAPTAAAGTNTTQIATTAFVKANAAPGGYGLGEDSYEILRTDDQVKAITKNGWYWYANDNTPLVSGIPITKYVLFFATCNSSYVILRGWCIGGYGDIEIRWMKCNGTWGNIEFVNPPLEVGTEYRTTERYLGKPVYVRVASLTIPTAINTDTAITLGSNLDKVISVDGIAIGTYGGSNYEFTIPYKDSSVTFYGGAFAINGGITYVYSYTNSGFTWASGYAIAKYTKTTD